MRLPRLQVEPGMSRLEGGECLVRKFALGLFIGRAGAKKIHTDGLERQVHADDPQQRNVNRPNI